MNRVLLSVLSALMLLGCNMGNSNRSNASGSTSESSDEEQGTEATTTENNAGAAAAAPQAQAAPSAAPAVEPPAVPEDVAAAPESAERTESGLASRVLQAGTGTEHPDEWDDVTVHYTGWRAEDGEMFDSSVTRGRPATFGLNRVIPGWTEGVQLMVVGEKRRFWIPANLAYEGRPGPQGTLVFDVELLSITDKPAPPETPSDVSAAPANAERTESGLASRVLQPGTGAEHPDEWDEVTVHYTGWRAEDGEMFDSSVTRGRPATFPLGRVIPGWTEGVQLMVVGEKRRFWIPANLAYEGRRPKARWYSMLN